MSLNDILLPEIVIQELYKKSLVHNGNIPPKKASQKPALDFLGNNKKHVVIIVDNDEAKYLPDEQLNFLMGILAACKLSMDDVAILNLQNKVVNYQILSQELHAEKIFLFGVETSRIELPLHFPNYQKQSYNKQIYLLSQPLSLLQNDKIEKTKLWVCLKQVFDIK